MKKASSTKATVVVILMVAFSIPAFAYSCVDEIPKLRQALRQQPSYETFDEIDTSIRYITTAIKDRTSDCFTDGSVKITEAKIVIASALDYFKANSDQTAYFKIASVIENIGSARELNLAKQVQTFLEGEARKSIWMKRLLAYTYLRGSNGNNIYIDLGRANYLFHEAAVSGDIISAFELAVSYETSRGLPQNFAQAEKFYLQAAVGDHALAQERLGQFYYEVERNFYKAYIWFSIAAANSAFHRGTFNIEYGKKIGEKRDLVARYLDHETLKQAQSKVLLCQNSLKQCS